MVLDYQGNDQCVNAMKQRFTLGRLVKQQFSYDVVFNSNKFIFQRVTHQPLYHIFNRVFHQQFAV